MNTAFSYSVYAFALFLGFDFRIASLLSIVLGIAVSYFTQGMLVFGNMSSGAFSRFVMVWGLLYGAHITIVAACRWVGINDYVGGLVALPAILVMSYALQRFVVFRQRLTS